MKLYYIKYIRPVVYLNVSTRIACIEMADTTQVLDQSEYCPPPKKKLLITPLNSIPSDECPFAFTSPHDFFSSLISPSCSVQSFFNEYWEKKPLHIKVISKNNSDADERQTTRKNYFQRLFNLEVLKEIIKTEELRHSVDMVFCKYSFGFRTNYEKSGIIKYNKVNHLFHKEKMTLQFHQPQRFQKELWKIQEMLECFFGCLVGSNIYMTPSESQGLAPHYDDVEVFILQLEGSKVWKLYHPIKKLPKECSKDFTETMMKETTLIEEITLNAGDVLYFPRGTIHEAKVLDGVDHSTHITISTYHSHSWDEYITSTLPHLSDQMNSNAAALRSGLLPNFHLKASKDAHKKSLSATLKLLNDAMLKFADSDTIDPLTCDFFANRLPPFEWKNEPMGKTPSLDCAVRLLHPHHIFISQKKGFYEEDDDEDGLTELDDEEMEADSGNDEKAIFVYHSLNNNRSNHMVGTPKQKPYGLKFDRTCWSGLVKLQQASNEFIPVKDLKLPDLIGHDMLVGLWSEGIVETKAIQ